MLVKKSIGERIFDVCNILFMLVLMFVMVVPLWHVLMASFSDSSEIIRASGSGVMLWPKGFNFDAYKMVAKNPNVFSGYKITIFVVIFGTALSLLVTSFGAYALSRKNVMWKSIINKMIIFTMLFSGGMIPTYIIINNVYHLGNNLLVLILPGLVSQYNLMVMRTSFEGIPESIVESAKVDGANDFTILFKIVYPTSMAIIVVMILFYGVNYWNAWFNAMLYIRERRLYPLQLILREILLQNSTNEMTTGITLSDKGNVAESIKYAVIIVSTLPILCLYPFIQKYFVTGVMIGAVKG